MILGRQLGQLKNCSRMISKLGLKHCILLRMPSFSSTLCIHLDYPKMDFLSVKTCLTITDKVRDAQVVDL